MFSIHFTPVCEILQHYNCFCFFLLSTSAQKFRLSNSITLSHFLFVSLSISLTCLLVFFSLCLTVVWHKSMFWIVFRAICFMHWNSYHYILHSLFFACSVIFHFWLIFLFWLKGLFLFIPHSMSQSNFIFPNTPYSCLHSIIWLP